MQPCLHCRRLSRTAGSEGEAWTQAGHSEVKQCCSAPANSDCQGEGSPATAADSHLLLRYGGWSSRLCAVFGGVTCQADCSKRWARAVKGGSEEAVWKPGYTEKDTPQRATAHPLCANQVSVTLVDFIRHAMPWPLPMPKLRLLCGEAETCFQSPRPRRLTFVPAGRRRQKPTRHRMRHVSDCVPRELCMADIGSLPFRVQTCCVLMSEACF